MCSGFNNNFFIQQRSENFPEQPDRSQTNTADYRTDYKQHAYNASSVSSTISNRSKDQQSSESYDSQIPRNMKPGNPSFSSQTFHQSNITRHSTGNNLISQHENMNFQKQPRHQSNFTSHFNNPTSQQENRNFQQQPLHHSNITSHYNSNPTSPQENRNFQQQPHHQSNITSHFSSNPTSQQENRNFQQQPLHQSNITSQFNSNPTSQQGNRNFQQQPQQYYQPNGGSQMTSNRQQPYNAPTNICSSQEMKYLQGGEQSGTGQTPKFPTFNHPPPNSQHSTNLAQVSIQSNISQFSNLSSQQPNTNLQQQTPLPYPSNIVKHQFSGTQQPYNPSGMTRMPSPVPNQQSQIQQSRYTGPNQTSQFSMLNQMPPNSPHQSAQKLMVRPPPVLQTAYQSNTVSCSNASGSEKKDYHQQTCIHHQFSTANYQTSNTQQSTVPCNIQSELTNIQSIPSQHVHSIPSKPNQTSQFPVVSQLPPNSNYQPVQISAPTAISQTSNQTNVNNNFNITPSSQQEKNFQQTPPCHQSTPINQSFFNNKPLSQQGNTNLQQQVQYYQPIAVGQQTGNPQQLQTLTSGSVNATSVSCNPYSQAQQNSKPPELNQLPQITMYNLSNSQSELHQTPVVSTNSQVTAPVVVQSNLSTPIVYHPLPPPVPVQHHFANYPAIGSVTEASSVKSQNELDSEWISQWLVTRQNRKMAMKNKTSQIPEVRKLLSQAFTFLKALAFIRDSLRSSKSENNEVWDNKIKQAVTIKQRLETIIQKLLKPETTVQLVRKLNRIKKKRQLHRRQRERRKMEKIERQKKRLEIHRLLDSYMETEKEKVLQAKREEELKKEADNILSEVRKKLQEGKRAQERLRAIEKLRQARKDTAQKRGLHISEETDDQFSKKISLLKDIIQRQLQDYEAEEKALKVMLETEQEGQREQEETYRKERQKKLVSNMQKRIKECLFGDDEHLDASPQLRYYNEYYTQAECSLDALAQIRHQWDIYLVRPNDACGSSIPVSWVIPDPPSSDAWASALDLK